MIYTAIGFIIAVVIAVAVIYSTNTRPLPGTPAYAIWAAKQKRENPNFNAEADKKVGAVNQLVIGVISAIALIAMVGGLILWAMS